MRLEAFLMYLSSIKYMDAVSQVLSDAMSQLSCRARLAVHQQAKVFRALSSLCLLMHDWALQAKVLLHVVIFHKLM